MGEYCSMRVWQLRAGASAAELETLAVTGIAEMHRWISGIEQLALIRVEPEPGKRDSSPRYLMLTTFTNHEAYLAWRRIEEEGPDYWERYASVFMYWEQIARLVEEYSGDLIDLKQSDKPQPG
jgi:hypothetical protein